MWHGYICIERGTIGSGNWAALQALFGNMGTHGCPFPCWNTHKRVRLDGNAVIYESRFDPDEIGVPSFKQLLASEFGISVEDIEHTVEVVSYADIPTTVWQFIYNTVVRFTVRRFGQGGDWQVSGDACRGYVKANLNEWEGVQA